MNPHSYSNLVSRFVRVVIPTPGQALGSLFVSFVLLVWAQGLSILHVLGINSINITAAGIELQQRFSAILQSAFASQMALIAFWAIVGLMAYLVCWGAYNLVIEARNDITLATSYANRADHTGKHWRGAAETLGLKVVGSSILALVIFSSRYIASLWVALAGQFMSGVSPTTIAYALVAVLGFAFHLYLVLVLVQLTFTSWYRPTVE